MTITPGSMIGIIGGGQLGRMLSVAAAQLGYRCHIFAPEQDGVAGHVADAVTVADYDDRDALSAFAAGCDVVTYEFENVPVAPLRALERTMLLRPGIAALDVAQDRAAEKAFVTAQGGRVAPWAPVGDRASLDAALASVGTPAILKTRRLGYDGKGQARIMDVRDADAAFAVMQGQDAVLEGFVRFDAEFSVILARGADGGVAYWDSSANVHDSGILATSTLPPPPIITAQLDEARALSARLAAALDHVGVLTVEFFATSEGPLVNEIAPRVHNSGHWTIEGAVTSQFENHIRAICGLPLGSTATTRLPVTMRNLIGADADGWAALLADPACHLHLYGKDERRAGRKMGHATWVGANPA